MTKWHQTLTLEVEADTLEDALALLDNEGPECGPGVRILDSGSVRNVERTREEDANKIAARWLKIKAAIEGTPPRHELPQKELVEAISVSRAADLWAAQHPGADDGSAARILEIRRWMRVNQLPTNYKEGE